jgi:hypothetical protein
MKTGVAFCRSYAETRIATETCREKQIQGIQCCGRIFTSAGVGVKQNPSLARTLAVMLQEFAQQQRAIVCVEVLLLQID